jgi:tRNA dimethylallyltransferase
MNKLLVICGPTATGKTDLGILLAKKFNGEIVSADSRQVYKGMDIITGKDLPENSKFKIQNSKLNITDDELSVGFRKKDDVPVWLVDIVQPDYIFNVGEYALLVQKVIGDIWSRGKLTIVVGGTGFYIRAIIEKIDTVIIPPNKLLRSRMEKLDKNVLQQELMRVDPKKWEKMNESDRTNPRRLIRAVEIALYYQKNKQQRDLRLNPLPIDSLLMIGLKAPYNFLFNKIDERVEQRVKMGAVEEIKKLFTRHYSPYLPAFSATGYKELAGYLQGQESLADAVKSWKFKEHEYARSQMTWFRKNKRIHWFDITGENYLTQIAEQVEKWYTDNYANQS